MDEFSQGMAIIKIATLFLGLIALGIIALVYVYKNKQTQLKKERERQILESRIETHEQTLRTVSQEIHDNIGQVLTLAKMNVNAVDFSNHPAAVEKLGEVRSLLSKAINDLRDLSKSLSTDYISQIGLDQAIREQLAMLTRVGFSATPLKVQGDIYRLSASRELVVFRIVQEIFNNIAKHSEASTINVSMDYSEKILRISVQDDGKGFDVEKASLNAAKGIGIRNIQNRVKLINGSVAFLSKISEGTTVSLDFAVG